MQIYVWGSGSKTLHILGQRSNDFGVGIWFQADLEDKIRRLEEDKNNVDFSTGLWEQSTRRAKKRKLDPGDPDRYEQVTGSGVRLYGTLICFTITPTPSPLPGNR